MSSQTKLIKDILSSYNTILENKNLISELEFVKLDDTNYSNLKHDYDGTQNDSVNKALTDDIQAAAKSIGVTATITTAKTGHNEKTTSGYTSRHTNGTGVDVAKINGIGSDGATNATNGNAQFRDLGNKLKDALVSMGYKWNSESGNPKAVLWQTDTGGNHYNHLHISNNSSESSTPQTDSEDTTSKTDSTTTPSSGYFTKSTTYSDAGAEDATFGKELGTKLLNAFGIKEEKVYSSFGEKTKDNYGEKLIPKEHNRKIKSPVSGTIVGFRYVSGCNNPIAIEFEKNGEKNYLLYCGITDPIVKKNQNVSKGSLLGKTDSDVSVTLYDSDKTKHKIDSSEEVKKKNTKNKEDDSEKYKDSIYKSDDNEYTKLIKYAYNKIKTGKDIDVGTGRFKEKSTNEKISENIKRIKGLLK